MEIDFIIAFGAGIYVGSTACILLMLTVFGTSLLMIEEKRKYFFISLGLIIGMVVAYLIVTILATFIFGFTDAFFYFRFIFAGILIFIGAWQIIESRKERSLIFKTPEKIKTILKDFMDKNSSFYAFLIGFIFVFVKIPCSAGPYLALLYEIQNDPLLFGYILIYLLGMILPTIIILAAFRVGLGVDEVNDFRLKYRTHLRILSGALLIFLAIYLLIF